VDSSLWFGALTTLAGAALGGAISFSLNRQQIREARTQRLEAERSDRTRRSAERRLDVYADFLTHARSYRSAIRRPSNPESGPSVPLQEIGDLARACDAACSLVFLVSQSRQTAAACREVMRTVSETSGVLHTSDVDMTGIAWEELNDKMSRVLRDFQAAARAELGIDEGEAAYANQ
jgi:hypothetical protein